MFSINSVQTINPPSFRSKVKRTLFIYSLVLVVANLIIQQNLAQTSSVAITGLVLWSCCVYLLWKYLPKHPFEVLGIANHITLCRTVGTVLLASLIPLADQIHQYTVEEQTNGLWTISLLIILLLILDGLDGIFARRQQLCSEFGARFDMEVDALLTLVLSLLIWLSGTVEIWVLGLGLLRYLFVFCAIWIPPLQAPLYPSYRRKLICVIQLSALCLIISPLLSPSLDQITAAVALTFLTTSFITDIHWLLTKNPSTT